MISTPLLHACFTGVMVEVLKWDFDAFLLCDRSPTLVTWLNVTCFKSSLLRCPSIFSLGFFACSPSLADARVSSHTHLCTIGGVSSRRGIVSSPGRRRLRQWGYYHLPRSLARSSVVPPFFSPILPTVRFSILIFSFRFHCAHHWHGFYFIVLLFTWIPCFLMYILASSSPDFQFD